MLENGTCMHAIRRHNHQTICPRIDVSVFRLFLSVAARSRDGERKGSCFVASDLAQRASSSRSKDDQKINRESWSALPAAYVGVRRCSSSESLGSVPRRCARKTT